MFDFLKKIPKPADDWAPPATPRYDREDENSDYRVYDKQYGQWEKDLRRYLKGKGYSQIKPHYYEPGGTPLSMRGRDGKYHEVWYPEENELMRPPTALEDIYDSGDPNQEYRKGPGLMLVGPKSASTLYKQVKQADVSLQRVLGTALASTGGGLLLGSYPGWKLQRASEAAGNSDFTNFVAGKAPIAFSGALSAGLYNHWLDRNEKKPEEPENPAHPSMQYLKYLVH